MKEILLYNYWEHVKAGKDLAFVLPPESPKLVAINIAANEILTQIHELGKMVV